MKTEMDTSRAEDVEGLFRFHYRKLCLYATHIVGDVDAAEDIVMEQFVKLAERSERQTAVQFPKSYLYQMVRNASLDAVRTSSVVLAADVEDDLPDDEDELEERLGREARLWMQIDRLPPACRRILLMSKQKDMSYKEIAASLGISIKTVEAQIGKAYKTLRGKAHEIYLMLFL